MKELVHKIIQTCTAISISCMVVYGIVYAQQVCCSDMVITCIPASNRIFSGYTGDRSWTSSQSYERNTQLRPNLCSKKILADFSPGNECCEADRCDNYKQTAYFSLSLVQDLITLQKTSSSFEADDGMQTAFEPHSKPTALNSVPIYILTQSIIC
jgi:hypothetical protein